MTLLWVLVGATVGALIGAALRLRGYSEAPLPRLPWWTVFIAAGSLAVLFPLLWHREQPVGFSLGVLFSVGGLVCFWTDLDVRRLPDKVTWPLAAALAAVAGVDAFVTGSWGRFVEGTATAIGCGAVFLVLAALTSLGLGDAKLVLSVGFVLGYWGWPTLAQGLLATCMIAVVWAVVLLVRGRSKTDHLPLGPALVVGPALAILLASA